ncbi:hypothetical protein GOP47_0007205 [Adiantum capillus-veneris]|uniref:Uncharacterized protein n=1 Tax=Adiantum capillus-veneris TaxID=13818 RepID=A0A9D4ZLA9_ADICA|nr:hypothetical protein GOP47_0007205 [Adiantum capillus-veneris]
MATLLLVDGVRWGNRQQAGACSFPPSLHRPDHCTSCGCNRSCEPCSSTTRCASSNNSLDRLDPPLPRIPDHYTTKRTGMPGPRLVIEVRPTLLQPYHDERTPDTLAEPSSPSNGDTSSQISITSDGQEVKRNYRVSPSYLSMSQSRRAMASGAVLQAASSSLQTKELKGTTGFYVGFATVVLGLMAVLQKGGLLGNSSAPTAVCTSCYGYGRRPCNLCKGSGTVTWEGKLMHMDVCPSCLGTRIKKCSECGGYRMRNDAPPFLQQMSKARMSKP